MMIIGLVASLTQYKKKMFEKCDYYKNKHENENTATTLQDKLLFNL